MVLVDIGKIFPWESIHGGQVYRAHVFRINERFARASHPNHTQSWALGLGFFVLTLAVFFPSFGDLIFQSFWHVR